MTVPDSAYTPFARRFTDERAWDETNLHRQYEEVRAMHLRSKYASEDALPNLVFRIFEDLHVRLPEPLTKDFAATLCEVARLESTIFDFPEIKWSVSQLSLKEQVDLQRFLTAKRYFLTNEDRVIDFFLGGLYRFFDALTEKLPELSGPSPFTIPLIYALPEPKKVIDRLIQTAYIESYIDNGLFVELGRTLHLNLCAASGISEPENPKGKAFKLPSESDEPLSDLIDTYLKGTPFHDFLMQPVPLRLTYEERYSHTHIVGGSGAGKTQLLQHLILHDLQNEDPPALVIVDSQTDLINKLSRLDVFHPEHGRLKDRLILITPKDTQYPPALNIFDVNKDRFGSYSEETREQVTAGVIDTFDYVFSGLLGAELTAKQDVFFKFIARLLISLPDTMGRNATIMDMIHLMEDAEPYQKAIENLPPIQRRFFERDFIGKAGRKNTFDQTKEQVRYRLNAILENPTLARLFTSPTTKVDLFSELNRGSIILVDTSREFLKGASANFGRIFISLVLQAVQERAAIPERQRKPAFLVVDEAANYFDRNIDDLLTEARKYRLGCVFAHQFLDQASHSLRSSLSANASIKMVSGVSTADARAMAPDMRTDVDFILSQKKLQFATHIRNVTPQAVSVPVVPGELERLPTLDADAYDRMRQRNRIKVSLAVPKAISPPYPRLSPDEDGTKTSSDW